MKERYLSKEANLLHIYARHLTGPEDAIETFFCGVIEWNTKYERFETRTTTHEIYWFWLVKDDKVMVISCFRK